MVTIHPMSPCCHCGHYNSPDVDPSSLLTVELFPSHLPHSSTGPRRLYCVVGAVVIAVAVVRYKSQHRHFTPGCMSLPGALSRPSSDHNRIVRMQLAIITRKQITVQTANINEPRERHNVSFSVFS